MPLLYQKKDTMSNPVLHVIPITSKKHDYNMELDNILYNKEKIDELKKLLIEESSENIKKIKECIKYKPINEFDYIDKIKISNELLRKIDEEIVKEYTLL